MPFFSPERRLKEISRYRPPHPVLPWNWLKDADCSILADLERRWVGLLADRSQKESAYRMFIANHPSFFFTELGHPFFVLTETRLGSDFVIDFAVPYDDASHGVVYTLIEIESPHTAPFTKKGQPAECLVGAIQQITNWKVWIRDHRAYAQDLFPCCYFPGKGSRFRFLIVIGDRSNSEAFVSKRNAYAEQYGIKIRSFDRLTDHLRGFVPPFPYAETIGTHPHKLPLEIINALNNPFYRAFSDRDWRKIRGELLFTSHLINYNADVFLKHRQYSMGYLSSFSEFCQRKGFNLEEALHKSRFCGLCPPPLREEMEKP